MQEKLKNFVIFPRKIAFDLREGLITRDEFLIYAWLRLTANPYGKSVTSLSNLSDDLFGSGKTENYMNKLLLSLKSKRFIYYKKRSGRRGTFEVLLADFLTPTKAITNLDKYFEKDGVRGLGTGIGASESEVEQSLESPSQRLETINDDIWSTVSALSLNHKARGFNNDTDNDKNKEKNRREVVSFKREKNIKTEEFKPNSFEEQLCLRVALDLGEKKMNFILSILDRYGSPVIEKSWKTYELEVTHSIDNKPAFFNTIVQRILRESGLLTVKNPY